MIASSRAKNISTMLSPVQAIVDPWTEAAIDYQRVIKIKKLIAIKMATNNCMQARGFCKTQHEK